jgi:hypothetical protein
MDPLTPDHHELLVGAAPGLIPDTWALAHGLYDAADFPDWEPTPGWTPEEADR